MSARSPTRTWSDAPTSCSSRMRAPAPGGSSGPGPARSASAGLAMPSNRQRTRPGSPSGRQQVLSPLQERLGYRFPNLALPERATHHPPVSVDPDHTGGTYGRLEFLGDRVPGLMVGSHE